MRPEICGETPLASAKFLKLREITYCDGKGKMRKWESADRIADAKAVMIVPHISPDDEYLFIRQFRPPTGKMMIEFPAGLVDSGETPENTAMRELYEETGYAGKLTRLTNFGFSSPGMSGEPIAVAFVEIDGNAYRDGFVTAHMEECESIETFRVKRRDIDGFIRRCEAQGDGIDTKIYLFAAALQK